MSKDPRIQQFQAQLKEKLSKKTHRNVEDFNNEYKKDLKDTKITAKDAKSPLDLLINCSGQFIVLYLRNHSWTNDISIRLQKHKIN